MQSIVWMICHLLLLVILRTCVCIRGGTLVFLLVLFVLALVFALLGLFRLLSSL